MATVQPALLVLDPMMPGLDGFSICQGVKAYPGGKRTKIIAMTGFVQEGNLAKALECGTDQCLGKPFQLKILQEMVAKLLGETRNQSGLALGLERRRSLRVQAESSVMCTPLSSATSPAMEPKRGKTLNVSREGLLMALNAPIEPFILLALEILLKDGHLPIHVVGESRGLREESSNRSHRVGSSLVAIPTQVGERWAGEIYSAS
jgi:hypothetical protein